jgi:hypothetical protein
MKDNSLYQLGGAAAILVGISYAVIGITTLLVPPFVMGVPDAQLPIMYFEENKALLLTNWWGGVFVGVFGLAMIPAVARTVRHFNEGWVGWVSNLALLASAAVLLDNYWGIVFTEPIYRAYTLGSEATRAALTAPNSAQWLESRGWLGYGAMGLWILVCSYLALRHQAWPRGLAYLGILSAFIYFLALSVWVIPVLMISGMLIVVGGIAVVLAPIFYIWMGIHLRQLES